MVDSGHWKRLLSSLPGQPLQVVTDGGLAGRAAATVWPQAHAHRCEWHLARNLTACLPIPLREDRSDRIHALLADAQRSVAGWEAFSTEVRRRAAAGGYENAVNTVNRLDPIIRVQAADQTRFETTGRDGHADLGAVPRAGGQPLTDQESQVACAGPPSRPPCGISAAGRGSSVDAVDTATGVGRVSPRPESRSGA